MQAPELAAIAPSERARLIYAQARSELSDLLWRAAIGGAQEDGFSAREPCRHDRGPDLLSLLGPQVRPPLTSAPAGSPDLARILEVGPVLPSPMPPLPTGGTPSAAAVGGPIAGLGANAGHAATLQRAAERSGIPASALAAIVDAEAAKRPDGSWNLMSRNPRSSAAGLGQFLSGTWVGMAETPGNWLHDVARQQGWLDERSRVRPESRAALLALRYDAEAAINTIADYARANIHRIRSAGVAVSDVPQAMAHLAYLGHHLGPGDAIRFLKNGLGESRAAHLLKAQIGGAQAHARISSTGSAAAAHRQWLNAYVASNVRPDRYLPASEASGA